jgi:hypothetical protein
MVGTDIGTDTSLSDVASSGSETRLKPDLAAAVNCF